MIITGGAELKVRYKQKMVLDVTAPKLSPRATTFLTLLELAGRVEMEVGWQKSADVLRLRVSQSSGFECAWKR